MKYLYENRKESIPSADNETSAKDIFTEKDLYEEKYPRYAFRPHPMEVSQTMRSLYGRVDSLGFSVIPNQSFVTQLSETDEPIFSLSIVKECFEEMVSYWKKLDSLGKLSKNSVTLKVLEPKVAITSGIRALHDAHIQSQFEFFNKKFVRSDNQIKTYADYERDVRNLAHYLRGASLPLTLSEFCVSKAISSAETGLVIDIALADPSEDSEKYQGFIRDPNYESYTRVAYRFGFKVDKNIPWRIYFDLSSDYAKEKMSHYGIYNLESFFERYYVRAVDVEFPQITKRFASLYRSYVEFSPTYQNIKPCPTSLDVRSAYAQGAAKVTVKTKEVVTEEILNTRYDTQHWLRLYAYFRSVETSKTWTQAQFDNLIQECLNIYTYRSESQAIHLLESNFTDRTKEFFQKKSLTNDNVFDTLSYKDKPTYTF